MSDTHVRDLPQIESAFQPILSLAHGIPVGYEALLRARHDGASCAPEAAFSVARRLGRYGEYERACALHHVRRFDTFAAADSVLFINLHPDVLVDPEHGPGLAQDILTTGVSPSRIVIEILEAQQETTAVLADAVARLREHGFLIALDDFGAGLTNLGRVWDLCPDVVKLDRELICKAASSYRNSRSLLRLVDLLHDIGTFIVVEGVETKEQALLSVDCDADFAQGYYFARPSVDVEQVDASLPSPRVLAGRLATGRRLRRVADLEELEPYRRAFGRMKEAFCQGDDMAACAAHFLPLDWALRVFVLDEHGVQVGENIESDRYAQWHRTTFPLLERRLGANWSKRAYFRNSLVHSGQIVVSDPYMSSSSTNLCVTLSVHVRTGGRAYVLCADVLFEGLSQLLQ
ncbi:sensor domain-containing phosphodiesterase [Trinickia fusca]|uniref:EAL domain-containing protein n=1 Tax=Trinickia fusca TaxID=2419777 RepID=A0A494X5J7_9BURK|nr:EAL domain-containing protein [Trinickia fusca]RKP45958.1 EAL domain-containing protein [Trinickia fusca]